MSTLLAMAICSVESCDETARSRTWCNTHYQWWKKNQRTPTHVIRRKSEGWLDKNGYRHISVKSKDVLEHRYIMEQHLGRPLRSFENIHHKNGVRSDNRVENLEIWVTKQPLGQRPEDLVAWAKEILYLYDHPGA